MDSHKMILYDKTVNYGHADLQLLVGFKYKCGHNVMFSNISLEYFGMARVTRVFRVSAQSFFQAYTLASSNFTIQLASPGGRNVEYVHQDDNNRRWFNEFRKSKTKSHRKKSRKESKEKMSWGTESTKKSKKYCFHFSFDNF
ncbi:hypothetical protein KUTeg_023267 [Tegillarca granosa]|uniref:Uncharacterized protein n=1 Tax=Tegillarca granosa TaxID=220873 RepID=A0ABQ9E5P9_TEGGR|nr:hypothetical protein KUTeg_023267 [Tegillarca granosa]